MKCLSVFVALVLAGCSTAQVTQPGDAQQAIAGLNRQFSDAVRRGDAAAMAAMYADTAVVMPPNMAAARGREAIRQLWSGFLSGGKTDLILMTDNVIQSCDLATEIGRYEMTITPAAAGAAPVHDTGKYAVTWRKIDGQWRIVADIFNSDLPVAYRAALRITSPTS